MRESGPVEAHPHAIRVLGHREFPADKRLERDLGEIVLLRTGHEPDRLRAGRRRWFSKAELRALHGPLVCELHEIARPERAAFESAKAAARISRRAAKAALDREPALDREITAGDVAQPAHAKYLPPMKEDTAPAAKAPRALVQDLDLGVAAGDADAHGVGHHLQRRPLEQDLQRRCRIVITDDPIGQAMAHGVQRAGDRYAEGLITESAKILNGRVQAR